MFPHTVLKKFFFFKFFPATLEIKTYIERNSLRKLRKLPSFKKREFVIF